MRRRPVSALTADGLGEPLGWNVYIQHGGEPGCPAGPATEDDFAGFIPNDGDAPAWVFAGLSDQVTWRRCACPWWHHLPFVGRRVHSDLP